MKRIFIIGNGFDLAHGLATSYKDFIDFLIKDEIVKFINDIQQKKFIEFYHLTHEYFGEIVIPENCINDSWQADEKTINKDEFTRYLYEVNNSVLNDSIHTLKTYFIPPKYYNTFINQVLDLDNPLWGKIELQYFEELNNLFNQFKINFKNPIKRHEVLAYISVLNESLDYIKVKLCSYLKKVESNNEHVYRESTLEDLIIEPLNKKTLQNCQKIKESIELELNGFLFLNFNYLDTFRYLLNKKSVLEKSEIINIHGDIDNIEDVIFGFGDENTEEYKAIENSEDVFLENIKSFKYLSNDNYDKLINYLYGDYYEVYLLGHSCSVTDRVLLKKVFENPKCLSIKIIPRNGNKDEYLRFQNFREISFNIARIFDDNGLMRDKVIPYKSIKESLPYYEITLLDYLKSK